MSVTFTITKVFFTCTYIRLNCRSKGIILIDSLRSKSNSFLGLGSDLLLCSARKMDVHMCVCICRGEVTDSKNYRVINVWTGGWLIYINNCHFYSSLYKTTFTCKLLEKKCLKHFSPFAAVFPLPLYTLGNFTNIRCKSRSCLSDMPAYFVCCPLNIFTAVLLILQTIL